ncbi:MAG: EAL domain-containing protein [Hydrogenophilaceae bacterium]|nr:EAL domain-containing protein [Hydrogenophilaceae bacterium]
MVAGFVTQLLLILFVTFIGLAAMNTSEQRLMTITQQHLHKLQLSKAMVFLARERTLNLFKALHAEDMFERDALYLEFTQMANRFVTARSELLTLPLTPQERRLLDEQRELTRHAVPIQEEVMQLARDEKLAAARKLLMAEAIPAQNAVLDVLSRLDEAARGSTQEAIASAEQAYAAARFWMYSLCGAALLIGIVVAAIVIAYTNRAGREREHMATHDALTGLPNRLLLMGRLEQAVARALRHKFLVGVMFIDLDRFKLVNDTLGHAAGDELIRQVAERLSGTVRSEDIVARLGGDEFVVVVTDADKVGQIIHVVDKVTEAVTRTYQIAGREIFVTCSIGISLCPNDGTTANDLLQHADTAMYHAKESGRNRYQMFDAEMNARVAQRLHLETDLRQGIARGEFQPYYQPQINLETQRIHVVEALMRWHHPTRGTMEPGSYLDLLEETGTIVELGRRLLLEACTQCAQWHAEGHTELAVAINLSGKEFWQADLVEFVEQALVQTKLPAQGLHLELTETILMQDIDQAVAKIQQFKQMGVRVAVDDFGTGYSSLAHLKHFPVDTLKIDRFFIKDIQNQPIDAAITRAIISLSESLGLDTVVEGVEDPQQLEALRKLGCRVVQGYLIGRPLPGKDIGAILGQDWTHTLGPDH